jgi:transcriptional regulator with XRE-family HTH domain
MVSTEDLLQVARRRRGLPDPELRRVIRERAGVSQAQIPAVLGVERAAISRWESGERSPRVPHRDAYAEVLERLATEVLLRPQGGGRAA